MISQYTLEFLTLAKLGESYNGEILNVKRSTKVTQKPLLEVKGRQDINFK